ncbi:MAG: YsnF/AvaK domain-containing protein [Pseudomonadota bacterium]|nr:YsnF/AvaK domain-containing protein [Pseudomonadota bacterium]
MQTVVGVFDTVDEAERARESLLDAGFDHSAIRMQSHAEMLGGNDDAYDRTTDNRTGSDTQDDGFMASVGRFFSNLFGGEDEHAGQYSEAVRRGNSVLVVTVDESRVESARATLAAAGAVDIDKRTESWREEGYAGFDPSARPFGTDEVQAERSRFQAQNEGMQTDSGTVLPVVREEIEVGKREVDLGAVRVFSHTEVRPVQEQVQLREERAEIERRAVDRPATEADLKAFEGSSIEIRETAERPVVSKTARVVEEVKVGTQATTHTETISDQVRNTVVDVENSATGSAPDYRSHYQTHRAVLGGTYDDYDPAYRYGASLRSDARYANRSWDEVEADAQRDWTSRYPDDSTWERTKQAVRHGWESMTGRR